MSFANAQLVYGLQCFLAAVTLQCWYRVSLQTTDAVTVSFYDPDIAISVRQCNQVERWS